jgi:hypothetical protein
MNIKDNEEKNLKRFINLLIKYNNLKTNINNQKGGGKNNILEEISNNQLNILNILKGIVENVQNRDMLKELNFTRSPLEQIIYDQNFQKLYNKQKKIFKNFKKNIN